jgi:hypothetical protein
VDARLLQDTPNYQSVSKDGLKACHVRGSLVKGVRIGQRLLAQQTQFSHYNES